MRASRWHLFVIGVFIGLSIGATSLGAAHLSPRAVNHPHFSASTEDAKRLARMTHRFWPNNDHAHDAQVVSSCENGMERIERADEYYDSFQVSAGLRRAFGWGRSYRAQAEATHRIYAASRREYGDGWRHWRGGVCA
jgi:hypothetical protein